MRINPFIYGALVLVLFFGVILGFQSAGIWSVSGKTDSSGRAVNPSATDVSTIKGWMTLEQIATAYNVPLADLLKQFNLPADTAPSTAVSKLENDTFSVTNLRTWLQSRMQPTDATPPAAPSPAPVATAAPVAVTPAAPTASTAATGSGSDRTINARTTFQNLYDWGVSKETVQKILGGDAPLLPSAVIKDYVTGRGLEFSTIKTQLQAEVDKIK